MEYGKKLTKKKIEKNTWYYHNFPHFLVCQFARHIHIPTVCISYLSPFSVFLATFQVIQCLCLIINVFQFSRHIPCPTVCISHFSRCSLFLPIFQVQQCLFLILNVFTCFSSFSRPYHGFLIFIICHFCGHIQGPRVCATHFPHF